MTGRTRIKKEAFRQAPITRLPRVEMACKEKSQMLLREKIFVIGWVAAVLIFPFLILGILHLCGILVPWMEWDLSVRAQILDWFQ